MVTDLLPQTRTDQTWHISGSWSWKVLQEYLGDATVLLHVSGHPETLP